ncbi:hypothetical protein EGY04_23410 [Enterobacter roggenkampii]|nr:hypothetical protein EGY04_23410 [Enterobacter roggenkampii]
MSISPLFRWPNSVNHFKKPIWLLHYLLLQTIISHESSIPKSRFIRVSMNAHIGLAKRPSSSPSADCAFTTH